MMQASAYGRLGKDPQEIQTKTGKAMTTANLAVDMSQRDAEATLWLRVVAFGRLAEQLAKHGKGDPLSVSGKLELNKWQAQDGAERESWQLIADSIISARTSRPSGGQRTQAAPQASAPSLPPAPAFDDPIPMF